MNDYVRVADRDWFAAFAYALPVVAVVLGLYYYWFAVADRYAVFLYGHLNATPFDAVTSSRYWMAGLVAAAVVMVPYNTLVWLLARLAAARRSVCAPPAWWRVWAAAAAPLAIGIVAIVTTVNSPVLPLPNALGSAVSAIGGLALALAPSGRAARYPTDLAWLAADGLALVPPLLLLRAIEVPGSGLSVTVATARAVALGGLAVAVLWLLVMSALRYWRRRPTPNALEITLAGLTISFLLLPLAHFLLATPAEYRYITASANFFANSPVLQIASLVVALALASIAVAVRRRLAARTSGPRSRR